MIRAFATSFTNVSRCSTQGLTIKLSHHNSLPTKDRANMLIQAIVMGTIKISKDLNSRRILFKMDQLVLSPRMQSTWHRTKTKITKSIARMMSIHRNKKNTQRRLMMKRKTISHLIKMCLSSKPTERTTPQTLRKMNHT